MESKKPELQLVTRFCEGCIYYTEYQGEEKEGFCHLTPRERAVKPSYFCSHGVWYEWSDYNRRWEPHMHGEVVPPPINPQAPGAVNLEEIRELIRRRGDDSEQQ